MPSSNTKSVKPAVSRTKGAIIIIAAIIALILFDLSLFGGNIRFYSKWVQCGQKPVQVQALPGKAWYSESPTFMPWLRNQSWYCSPIEAERAGYSANKDSYEAPALEAAGEPNPYEKKLLD